MNINIKPKDIRVNLPIVLGFDSADGAAEFTSHINTIVHGKVKIKYDYLGDLAGQFMHIIYLQRNIEYNELREEFMDMINRAEMEYDDS